MLESLHMLYLGLTELVSSYALVMCGFGGVLGVIIGALPGLGATAGCALLLPITYSMDPTVALVTLAAVYYGDMFGGGISAILINIPGDSHAAVTALDGYAMSRKGQAGKALFVGFFSSFVGGMLGAIVLTLMGSLLTNIGLAFGAPEMAAVILVAMTSIGWILGDAPYKGLIATGLGLLFATIAACRRSFSLSSTAFSRKKSTTTKSSRTRTAFQARTSLSAWCRYICAVRRRDSLSVCCRDPVRRSPHSSPISLRSA